VKQIGILQHIHSQSHDWTILAISSSIRSSGQQ